MIKRKHRLTQNLSSISVFIILIFLSSIVKGQNCFCISSTKDKEKNTETASGITSSKDFYSLLIAKELNYSDTTNVSNYSLSLMAASHVAFTESMLQTKGHFKLKLLDNTEMILDNVTYINKALGLSALGFQVSITEEQAHILSTNPIVTLIVPEIGLKTYFSPKKQKEQQKIFTCLINKQ